MARLIIIQKKRKFTPMLPHRILIGGQLLGLMRTPSVTINMPQGSYDKYDWIVLSCKRNSKNA